MIHDDDAQSDVVHTYAAQSLNLPLHAYELLALCSLSVPKQHTSCKQDKCICTLAKPYLLRQTLVLYALQDMWWVVGQTHQ